MVPVGKVVRGLLFLLFACAVLVASSGLLLACSSGSPALPSYDPLSFFTLRSDSFLSGEEYTITFRARDGYEAALVVPCERTGEVEVAVPLYVSPVSGEFGPSPMVAHFGSEAFAFLAGDLPQLDSAPGEGLAAGLGQSLVAAESALDRLETMSAAGGNRVDLEVTISVMTQRIASQKSLLEELVTTGRLILTDGTDQIALSSEQLALADRILYAQYSGLLQDPVAKIDLRRAVQASSGVSRNADWDRVSREVMAYWRDNGADRLEVLNQAMSTVLVTPTGPIDLQMDRPIAASAYAAAHTGVQMAWTAMAELTFNQGSSNPQDCQKLAEGIGSMETALQLMEINSWESAHGAMGVMLDGEVFQDWQDDNQAMFDTMRTWASQYCPEQTSRDYEGEYVGSLTWWTPRSNIVEILSSEARAVINGTEVTGRVQFVAKNVGPIPGHPNRTQRLTLTAEFAGSVDAEGKITGKGASTTQWEMISCEHPDGAACDNYVATTGGTGGEVTVVATISSPGTLEVELWWGENHNYTFDGRRQ